ncbi:MAG: hypothetical protein ABSB29_03720 [Nitrososphaerales archaeon]
MAGRAYHRNRDRGIASFIVVLAIIIAGFAIYVPITSMSQVIFPYTSTSYFSTTVPELVPYTNIVTYNTTSTIVVTTTQQTTTASQVWNTEQTTLGCDFNNPSIEWTSQTWALSVGMDLQVFWNASNTVDVYVFNSAQYGNWVNSGTTIPNVAEESKAPMSGSLSFQVSGSDTYYIVLRNPHLGLFCAGSSDLIIYSATGAKIYLVPVVSYITLTQTYTTSSQTITTQTATTTIVSSTVVSGTSTTATIKSCSSAFWGWLFGFKACP